MKKLLPILLILFALIGNSQVLVYPANYTLGNYGFNFNGTDNEVLLDVSQVQGETGGFIEVYFKTSSTAPYLTILGLTGNAGSFRVRIFGVNG